MTRARLAALFCAAVLVGTARQARADETTFCNVFITSLPYTISAQGHYCLDRNLSTPISSGNAITINSDFVVLDLNNFKLGGGAAGPATQTAGVFAQDRKNITIRGGNIRGFFYGIYIKDTSGGAGASAGHLVENNLLDGNTYNGIRVEGVGSTVRNNVVNATGGSTATGVTGGIAYGIAATGNGTDVLNNKVVNTFRSDSGAAYNIAVSDGGTFGTAFLMILGNRVFCNGTEDIGIYPGEAGSNRVKYGRNTVSNCLINYVSTVGTDIGDNH